MKLGNTILSLFTLNFCQLVGVRHLTTLTAGKAEFYKAAVYEHPVIFPSEKAESYYQGVDQMMLNLNEYKKQADIAGSQDVDIIVFPENGIYGYHFTDPSVIEPYLEFIPDPEKVNWTPCVDPTRYTRTKVQTFLSCLALSNSLYLVANFGDAQPCSSKDSECPENGQYQYNTNIVFDRKGKLIARYHKEHLYREKQFQKPAFQERITFDTEFGKFGIFTCFDILFYEPAIPIVEYPDITDVVFPTGWRDALPYFTAIGYHSSFAFAYNVNILSANLHDPISYIQGSGIYTPNGAINYFYDRESSYGRLLIDYVPIRKKTERGGRLKFKFGSLERKFFKKHDFKSKVRTNLYNFVSLTLKKEKVTVCQKGFCCSLRYERDQIIGNYAFGVFNGRHRGHSYYLQICVLLRCASQENEDCGADTYFADGYFNSFNIRGNFSTPYVTPQIIRSNNGRLELPTLNTMQFDTNGLTGKAKTSPLLHTTLVGRLYDELLADNISTSKPLFIKTFAVHVLNLSVFIICTSWFLFAYTKFLESVKMLRRALRCCYVQMQGHT